MTKSSDQKFSRLQSTSLTEPFAFRDRLRRPDTRIDFIPVLDLIVIAMLVSLLFTRFVSLPGVRIDLPATEMRMQNAQQDVAVLTIGNNGMLFFDGAVFELRTVERAFSRYVEAADGVDHVLLVKAHASMDMQNFLRLCALAKSAGFDQVQLAGQKELSPKQLLPSAGQRTNEN